MVGKAPAIAKYIFGRANLSLGVSNPESVPQHLISIRLEQFWQHFCNNQTFSPYIPKDWLLSRFCMKSLIPFLPTPSPQCSSTSSTPQTIFVPSPPARWTLAVNWWASTRPRGSSSPSSLRTLARNSGRRMSSASQTWSQCHRSIKFSVYSGNLGESGLKNPEKSKT